MTIFVGCGFAAKYREGGGVFSVPLQWMLGLKRLKLDAIWLEFFPGTGNESADRAAIRAFQRQVRCFGLRYCLLYQAGKSDPHDLNELICFGLTKRELSDRLAGPTTLLNLSYSIHPPLLLQFERRIFCDLDPSEIFYWMTKMELGQTNHHEFWTIGLNAGAEDCRLPRTVKADVSAARATNLQWKTFFPLVDTKLIKPQLKPPAFKFTTIGQWYWGGAVEVDGQFPDLSKKFAFEKYLELPSRVPETRFELAMNIHKNDPEQNRLTKRGWNLIDPHCVAASARNYYRYVRSASAEFTTIKGVDVSWRTGWLSDRAALFAAMGRPVITEDTGANKYLPKESGFAFVYDLATAETAAREVIRDWDSLSRKARDTAATLFDSAKNLHKILGL